MALAQIFQNFLIYTTLLSALIIVIQCEKGDEEENELPSSAPDKVEELEDGVRVEDSVLVLTENNFDDQVKKHSVLLVEFYAPWCGHCKNLAPEYAAAAEELAKNDPPVVLGKVDATVHAELAQRFEVSGYPTLRFFRDGKDFEYDGPRNKDGIIQYMKERAAPDWEPEPDAVITLTKDDFDEVVENEKLMLVEFYAPWCGHCKRLAPLYEKAAKQLKKEDPPILLAKVDATQESELATKYQITGYPTLKVFRDGRASDYKGERGSEYDIVSFMLGQVGDGAKEIKTLKELRDFFDDSDITIVGFFDSKEDAKVAPYKLESDDYRDAFTFGIVFDEEIRKAYKINPNSVVIFNPERYYTKYEPKWHVMEIKEDTTSDDIHKFVTSFSLPLVGAYSSPLKNRYDEKRPLCLVFYSVDFSFEHKEATQFWRKKIAAIANKYRDITFAVADDEENAKLLEENGLGESGEELNVVLLGPDGQKFPMEPMEEYDSDDLKEFLDKYKKGKLKPYLKSQRPPKKQSGPVTVVVGSTFEKIVMDPTKDVLIELYAPWCGHCKSLAPKYEALAKKLKKEKNLVIAKMDATANDAPTPYKASGFPTIYFAPSNNKDSPLKYEGGRDIDDFEDYLKEHATVSFDKKVKEEL
ncbi:protein disulfide-isomerase [Plakobranchus ocellatus]|uniref:Protein disulfide-isomerase n=1 Tax=Plakobranchus ocellatus TaxID=259542 RepID=A0AAV4C8G9_9GAST|nr:protein disulfide-isomerase [Plakobranchus ocellatus]